VGEIAAFGRGEADRWVRLLRSVAGIYARGYHDIRVTGQCRLPRQGPAIVVSNHTSGLDPVLIQAFCPRLIRWMMAREYFDLPALRWLYRMVGAIPVERSGRDMSATRAALRTLERGEVLGVFAEGKIEKDEELLPFQIGVGLLALRSRAPVFPVYLDGTQRGKEMLPAFANRNRVGVSFGEAIQITDLNSSRSDLVEATRRIEQAVARLKLASIKPARAG
jgi:1-acyl-sn-glycerol-3-phosphate acyltransferase